MRVNVRGTNVKVTEAMKSYAVERLQNLSRYASFLRDVTLAYSVQRAWHIAEITTRFGDTVLRAEERSNDMYVSVDGAVDKLEQQIHRLKGRMVARKRAASAEGRVDEKAEEIVALMGGEEDEEEFIGVEPLPDGQVVKVKTYSTRAMTTEEALLQMQLVGHDFYVFAQADGEINVVYKRRAGDFGLLVPEPGG